MSGQWLIRRVRHHTLWWAMYGVRLDTLRYFDTWREAYAYADRMARR